MKKYSSKNLIEIRTSDEYQDLVHQISTIADTATILSMQLEFKKAALAVANYKLADMLGYAEKADKMALLHSCDRSAIDAALADCNISGMAFVERGLISELKQWLDEDDVEKAKDEEDTED